MFVQLKTCWQDRLWRLAFLSTGLMGCVVAALMPYRSIIGIELLDFSEHTFAIIVFLSAALRVAFSLLSGVYTDQSGRYKQVLVSSASLGIIAGFLIWLYPTQLVFVLITVFLFPWATTAFNQSMALSQIAANRNPEIDADQGGSLNRASFSFAFAITPAALAFLIAAGMGLMNVYQVAAGACLSVIILTFLLWPKDFRADSQNKSGMSFFQALKELAALRILIRVIAIALGHGAIMLYLMLLGLMVLNDLNGTERDVGLFAGIVSFLEIPAMLFAPILLRTLSKPALFFIGTLLHAIYFIPFGLMGSMTYTWVLAIPSGIGAGFILVTLMAYLQQLFAHRPGAGGSLIAISQFLGMSIASLVFALGTAVTDYVGTAWIGAGLGLLGGLMLFVLDGSRIMSRAWLEKRGIVINSDIGSNAR